MHSSSAPKFVTEDLVRLGICIDDERIATLARYLDTLLDANRSFNLTSIRDRDEAWRAHIVDSMTLLPHLDKLDEGAAIIDVGSGGGLPGIPLAIARPNLRITLLDATRKKTQFLEACVCLLKLKNVAVVNDRAETIGQNGSFRCQFDIAVCRALALMSPLLECTVPLVKIDGVVLAMRGPRAANELKDARHALATLGGDDVEMSDAYPAGFGRSTTIVRVKKDRPTPKQYPRRPGVPRQSPL